MLDAWRGVILCLTLPLCAAVYSFRFTSFLHPKEAVLALALYLLTLLLALAGTVPRDGLRAFIPLWGLLAWVAVVHLAFGQAQVPAYTLTELLRGATLLLVAACVFDLLRRPEWEARIGTALLGSAFLVAALGFIQYAGILPALFPVFPLYDQRLYSVFGNQGLFGGYLALAVPLLVHRYLHTDTARSRYLAGLAALLPALLLSSSRTAWFAAAVGTAVVLPYGQLLKKRALILAALAAVLILATCLAAPQPTFRRLQQSFSESDQGAKVRLWFWDATLRMIRDAPVLGVGPGNYQYWSPRYHGEALHAPGGDRHYRNELHTLHAHSDPLEAVSETGIAGVLFLLWMLWRMRRCRGPEWGGLAALFAFSLLNATYQSPPHALCALLLMGALLARSGPAESFQAEKKSSLAASALCAAALCIALATVRAVLLPSYGLSSAREARDAAGYVRDAEALYRSLAKAPWPNYLARLEWAILLREEERHDEARRALTRAREGLDTGSIHYLLGYLAVETGDLETAREEFEECVWRWPSNREAWAALLALLPPEERRERMREAQGWLPEGALSGLLP